MYPQALDVALCGVLIKATLTNLVRWLYHFWFVVLNDVNVVVALAWRSSVLCRGMGKALPRYEIILLSFAIDLSYVGGKPHYIWVFVCFEPQGIGVVGPLQPVGKVLAVDKLCVQSSMLVNAHR